MTLFLLVARLVSLIWWILFGQCHNQGGDHHFQVQNLKKICKPLDLFLNLCNGIKCPYDSVYISSFFPRLNIWNSVNCPFLMLNLFFLSFRKSLVFYHSGNLSFAKSSSKQNWKLTKSTVNNSYSFMKHMESFMFLLTSSILYFVIIESILEFIFVPGNLPL